MPTTPHPADHPPRDLQETTYDVVVLGAGSTGENVADYAHRGGLSVAPGRGRAGRRRLLVLGLHAEQGAAAAGAGAGRGALGRRARRAAVTGELDVEAVLARRDSFTSRLAGRRAGRLGRGHRARRSCGGPAGSSGEQQVEVTGPDGDTVVRHRPARRGASAPAPAPALPPVEGLERRRRVDQPRRHERAGRRRAGSPCSAAGWSASRWRRPGRRSAAEEVTVLQHGERLLPAYEPEVGDAARRRRCAARGVDVRARHRGDPGRARRRRAGAADGRRRGARGRRGARRHRPAPAHRRARASRPSGSAPATSRPTTACG